MTSPLSSASTAAESVFSSATSQATALPRVKAEGLAGWSWPALVSLALTVMVTFMLLLSATVYVSGSADEIGDWVAKSESQMCKCRAVY
jgi:hypothetical protein